MNNELLVLATNYDNKANFLPYRNIGRISVKAGGITSDKICMNLEDLCNVTTGVGGTNTVLTFTGSQWSAQCQTFLKLNDTPNSYTGCADYIVKVNSGGTALEFIDMPSIGDLIGCVTPDDASIVQYTSASGWQPVGGNASNGQTLIWCSDGYWYSGDAAGGSSEFNNGGDACGYNRSLGNADYYRLCLVTSNSPRQIVMEDGRIVFGDHCTGEYVNGLYAHCNISGEFSHKLQNTATDSNSKTLLNISNCNCYGGWTGLRFGTNPGGEDKKFSMGLDHVTNKFRMSNVQYSPESGANTIFVIADDAHVGIGTDTPQSAGGVNFTVCGSECITAGISAGGTISGGDGWFTGSIWAACFYETFTGAHIVVPQESVEVGDVIFATNSCKSTNPTNSLFYVCKTETCKDPAIIGVYGKDTTFVCLSYLGCCNNALSVCEDTSVDNFSVNPKFIDSVSSLKVVTDAISCDVTSYCLDANSGCFTCIIKPEGEWMCYVVEYIYKQDHDSASWPFYEFGECVGGLVMAVGEGQVKVTDLDGNINIGDLLTSSCRSGMATKQMDSENPDPTIKSYTLGKALGSVNWDSISCDPVKGYKWTMLSAAFYAG